MSKQKLFKKTISGQREIYLGEISNGIYSRRVRPEHIYEYVDAKTQEKVPGWTVDKDAFEQRILGECTYLLIKDTENEELYQVSTQGFSQNAIPLRDRYFLALKYWEKKKDKLAFKRIEVEAREE